MADAFKEIIDRVKNNAGIPEDKARSAVDAVVGYIKDKSPAIGNQIDNFVHGGGGSDFGQSVKDKLGFK
jgi:hypothetical protein